MVGMGTDRQKPTKKQGRRKQHRYAMGYNKDRVIESDAKNRFRDL
jgi:hypothetical protein